MLTRLISHVTNPNVTVSYNLNTSLNNNTAQAPTRTRNRRKRKPRNTRTTIRLDTTSVINLSQTPLSHDESSVLARGLTFCPTPRRINWSEVSADINDFTRRMRLTEYFHDYNNASNPNQTNPFHNKSSWTPPTNRDSALNAYIDAIKHDISISNLNHITDNLTSHERQSLRNLKKRRVSLFIVRGHAMTWAGSGRDLGLSEVTATCIWRNIRLARLFF